FRSGARRSAPRAAREGREADLPCLEDRFEPPGLRASPRGRTTAGRLATADRRDDRAGARTARHALRNTRLGRADDGSARARQRRRAAAGGHQPDPQRDRRARARRGGRIWVRLDAEAERVQIVVEDDGPGVPESLRAAIFEPFFTTRRGAGGTGLGLSISRGIVDQHGGRLTVDERPGGGARFTVDLPTQ